MHLQMTWINITQQITHQTTSAQATEEEPSLSCCNKNSAIAVYRCIAIH